MSVRIAAMSVLFTAESRQNEPNQRQNLTRPSWTAATRRRIESGLARPHSTLTQHQARPQAPALRTPIPIRGIRVIRVSYLLTWGRLSWPRLALNQPARRAGSTLFSALCVSVVQIHCSPFLRRGLRRRVAALKAASRDRTPYRAHSNQASALRVLAHFTYRLKPPPLPPLAQSSSSLKPLASRLPAFSPSRLQPLRVLCALLLKKENPQTSPLGDRAPPPTLTTRHSTLITHVHPLACIPPSASSAISCKNHFTNTP
jgi:hypothetical protein